MSIDTAKLTPAAAADCLINFCAAARAEKKEGVLALKDFDKVVTLGFGYKLTTKTVQETRRAEVLSEIIAKAHEAAKSASSTDPKVTALHDVAEAIQANERIFKKLSVTQRSAILSAVLLPTTRKLEEQKSQVTVAVNNLAVAAKGLKSIVKGRIDAFLGFLAELKQAILEYIELKTREEEPGLDEEIKQQVETVLQDSKKVLGELRDEAYHDAKGFKAMVHNFVDKWIEELR